MGRSFPLINNPLAPFRGCVSVSSAMGILNLPPEYPSGTPRFRLPESLLVGMVQKPGAYFPQFLPLQKPVPRLQGCGKPASVG
jgi:hypothetical protein